MERQCSADNGSPALMQLAHKKGVLPIKAALSSISSRENDTANGTIAHLQIKAALSSISSAFFLYLRNYGTTVFRFSARDPDISAPYWAQPH